MGRTKRPDRGEGVPTERRSAREEQLLRDLAEIAAEAEVPTEDMPNGHFEDQQQRAEAAREVIAGQPEAGEAEEHHGIEAQAARKAAGAARKADEKLRKIRADMIRHQDAVEEDRNQEEPEIIARERARSARAAESGKAADRALEDLGRRLGLKGDDPALRERANRLRQRFGDGKQGEARDLIDSLGVNKELDSDMAYKFAEGTGPVIPKKSDLVPEEPQDRIAKVSNAEELPRQAVLSAIESAKHPAEIGALLDQVMAAGQDRRELHDKALMKLEGMYVKTGAQEIRAAYAAADARAKIADQQDAKDSQQKPSKTQDGGQQTREEEAHRSHRIHQHYQKLIDGETNAERRALLVEARDQTIAAERQRTEEQNREQVIAQTETFTDALVTAREVQLKEQNRESWVDTITIAEPNEKSGGIENFTNIEDWAMARRSALGAEAAPFLEVRQGGVFRRADRQGPRVVESYFRVEGSDNTVLLERRNRRTGELLSQTVMVSREPIQRRGEAFIYGELPSRELRGLIEAVRSVDQDNLRQRSGNRWGGHSLRDFVGRPFRTGELFDGDEGIYAKRYGATPEQLQRLKVNSKRRGGFWYWLSGGRV